MTTTHELRDRLRGVLRDYLAEFGEAYSQETFVDFVVAQLILTPLTTSIVRAGRGALVSFYQSRICALPRYDDSRKPFPVKTVPVARVIRNGKTRELHVHGVFVRTLDVVYDPSNALQKIADKINAAAATAVQKSALRETLTIRGSAEELTRVCHDLLRAFGPKPTRKPKLTKKASRSR